jgi:hypothetical protein
MGPSTVPSGMQEVTAIFFVVFSKSTVCVLFARKDAIQIVIWSDIPYYVSLEMSLFCGTFSNAFAKSIIIKSI